ncbi:hypothetical protein EUGRSUZ_G01245 [Eucalyptus grandis]|uniref:TF-B3 domain-containing protein n=2 Tax=Eucalyptus grandis TaxID=71139 RepID=A0A059BBK8_EUCGR|nr:hypothetical protein EUGRSUZ_G01245 [Eucalyptus grandis]
MASCSRRRRRRRREDGAVEPEVVAGRCRESRCFFKIILSDTLESGKLGIPKSFLRRCGKDLSNSVLLQVPGGSTWTIELEKCNNDMVSLWKGWQDFMEYYSIGHGHLIVFKYIGNSTFGIIIFDKSTSEIDYSLSSGKKTDLGSKFPSPKTEDVVEAEDPEELITRRKMRVESHLPYSQLSPIYSPRGSKDGIRRSRCKMNHSEPFFGGPTCIGPLSGFELASEFESEYPFFKVMMQPSYLKHHILYVPRRFIMQHIRKIKEIAILRHSGRYLDRSWPLKLLRYKQDHKAFFSGGWPAFARENCLHVGDVCMFELIDREDFVFEVSIFCSAGTGPILTD